MTETKKNKQKEECAAEKPYERFVAYGPESLTEAELLAIILRTGTKGEDTVSIGNRILKMASGRQTGLLGLHHISIAELMTIKGIGEVKAVRIKCIAELSKRMAAMSAKETLQFTRPSSVAAYYMERMRHEETERTVLLLLDGRNNLLDEIILSQGTVNASLVSTREIFIHALKAQAVYIMLVHNHPSGSPQPSGNDLAVTEKINAASRLMDIGFIDHIIIGDNDFVSLRQQGVLA